MAMPDREQSTAKLRELKRPVPSADKFLESLAKGTVIMLEYGYDNRPVYLKIKIIGAGSGEIETNFFAVKTRKDGTEYSPPIYMEGIAYHQEGPPTGGQIGKPGEVQEALNYNAFTGALARALKVIRAIAKDFFECIL